LKSPPHIPKFAAPPLLTNKADIRWRAWRARGWTPGELPPGQQRLHRRLLVWVFRRPI